MSMPMMTVIVTMPMVPIIMAMPAIRIVMPVIIIRWDDVTVCSHSRDRSHYCSF